jgi:signal transduction histidine kinase
MTDLVRRFDRLRLIALDGALALAAGSAVVLTATVIAGLRIDPGDAALTALLVVMPLALRRVAPTVVALAVGAGIVATNGRLEVVDLAAFAVATFTLGSSAASRRGSLASLAVITSLIGLWFAFHGAAYAIGLGYLVTVPAWLAGDAWRERGARATARTVTERSERDRLVREAILAERRRLARELHDVVAHDVGVMVVQAGGARQVLATSPERARAALETVEATGRDALAELRRLLDLLAEDATPGAALAPRPTLADIDAMVERLRDAGVSVALRTEGQPRPLPDGLGTTAYRIVQEALTNAITHARGAPASVVVAYGDDALVLEVLDDGAAGLPALPARPPGRGLRGMRDRAEAWGGTLDAGPRPGQGFAVRAWLPLEPTAR